MSDLTRVKLSKEEWDERARNLADKVRAREILKEDFKGETEQYRAALKLVDQEIKRLADAVRTGVEDRERQIGMFARG